MEVGEVMTRKVRACCETATLGDAVQLLWEGDYGCLPVLSSDGSCRVVGMITDRDICIATHFRGATPKEIPVTNVMAKTVRTIGAFESVADAEAVMRDAQVRRLPVVDREDRLVGMITLFDLIELALDLPNQAGCSHQEIYETLEAVSQPRRVHLLSALAS